MKKLLIYLRDYKKESILAPAFKMLEATFDLLVPLVMAAIINTGIANKDKGYILSHCGLLILLGVIGLTAVSPHSILRRKHPLDSVRRCGMCCSHIFSPLDLRRWTSWVLPH